MAVARDAVTEGVATKVGLRAEINAAAVTMVLFLVAIAGVLFAAFKLTGEAG